MPNSKVIKYLSSMAIDKMYPEEEKVNEGLQISFELEPTGQEEEEDESLQIVFANLSTTYQGSHYS